MPTVLSGATIPHVVRDADSTWSHLALQATHTPMKPMLPWSEPLSSDPGSRPPRRCFKEETFGPLLPLFRFRTDAEAVLLANDTEYGLAAYAYTKCAPHAKPRACAPGIMQLPYRHDQFEARVAGWRTNACGRGARTKLEQSRPFKMLDTKWKSNHVAGVAVVVV
jgi:hypothetical protein